MELYAYRLLFHKDTNKPYKAGEGNPEDYKSERLNFDNFANSFVANFVMLAIDS
jgi:hypothetical protein